LSWSILRDGEVSTTQSYFAIAAGGVHGSGDLHANNIRDLEADRAGNKPYAGGNVRATVCPREYMFWLGQLCAIALLVVTGTMPWPDTGSVRHTARALRLIHIFNTSTDVALMHQAQDALPGLHGASGCGWWSVGWPRWYCERSPANNTHPEIVPRVCNIVFSFKTDRTHKVSLNRFPARQLPQPRGRLGWCLNWHIGRGMAVAVAARLRLSPLVSQPAFGRRKWLSRVGAVR